MAVDAMAVDAMASQSTMQIAIAFVVKQVHDLWNLINCLIAL